MSSNRGAKLNRGGRRIIVSKDGETLAQVATLQIGRVVLFGNVQVTTQALRLLLDEGVEVVLLSEDGRFYGRLVGAESGHGALRANQVLCSQDVGFALLTAQQIVYGKLHNIKMFLERQAQQLKSETVQLAVAGVEHQLRRTLRTTTHNSFMGVKGQGTAIYFGVWKALLQPPWRFEGRVRRPPTDPVNVLLSYGYTVLLQNVLGAVLTVGLDPYVGFLHRLEYNRPSLALDLMEEFRPLIVDSVVLHCLNNGVIKGEHFRSGESEDRPILLRRKECDCLSANWRLALYRALSILKAASRSPIVGSFTCRRTRLRARWIPPALRRCINRFWPNERKALSRHQLRHRG
ncbi:MAG: CRISPR-associated endonuclease Cas1, partial [Caldilinea sp.]|nr:CRISPR-associated endonuclease Cas1 [Caldilinea sp.]MDW8442222.1 CRISPR-associated endonuclease Cas1 [Caldilineaceae bacterium]